MKVLYGGHYGAETVSIGNAGDEVKMHETPGMRIQIRLEGWKGEKNKLVGHCWKLDLRELPLKPTLISLGLSLANERREEGRGQ